jgi:hypothetical protein
MRFKIVERIKIRNRRKDNKLKLTENENKVFLQIVYYFVYELKEKNLLLFI